MKLFEKISVCFFTTTIVIDEYYFTVYFISVTLGSVPTNQSSLVFFVLLIS